MNLLIFEKDAILSKILIYNLQWLFMFEHRRMPLLPKPSFYRRLFYNGLFALLLLFVSLAGGMWGYHHFEKMHWIDSFASASMILSGMGPLEPLKTDAGKLFAGFYALYSGVAFLIAIAVALAPVLHRFYHKFHLETEEQKKTKK